MALSRTNKLSPHSCRFSNKTGDNGPFTYKQTLSSLLQVFQQNHQTGRQWGVALRTGWPGELLPGAGAGGGAGVQPRGDLHHHRERRPLPVRLLPPSAGLCAPRSHTQDAARYAAGKQENTVPQPTADITLHITGKLQCCNSLLMCCAAGNQEITVLQLTADVLRCRQPGKYSAATHCRCMLHCR